MNLFVLQTPEIQTYWRTRQKQVTFASIGATIGAMIWRDALVSLKQFHVTLMLLLIQPAMLLLALGRIQQFTGTIPPSFAAVLLPGILGTMLVAVSIQAVSVPLTNEFSYTREIEDRLLSPLPVWLVGIEKVFIGVFKCWLCTALYFPLAWLILGPELYHPVVRSLGLLAVAVTLSSLMMSSLGLIMGSKSDGPQAQIVIGILLVPMSFLGCVYFPWAALAHTPVLQYLILINPQTYISESLRATMTTQPHMDLLLALVVLTAWSALFLFFGLRAFVHRAIN